MCLALQTSDWANGQAMGLPIQSAVAGAPGNTASANPPSLPPFQAGLWDHCPICRAVREPQANLHLRWRDAVGGAGEASGRARQEGAWPACPSPVGLRPSFLHVVPTCCCSMPGLSVVLASNRWRFGPAVWEL